jgi:uncharacterized membrane protein YqhA
MLARLVGSSRYLILIAIVAIFLAALLLMIYGGVLAVRLVGDTYAAGVNSKGAKSLLLGIIELVDLFLLATTLYVIAAGLYELFIDDRVPLPAWLGIQDLDDLKDKLIKVVIVVLGVLFLGQVITWDGQRDLLSYGAAIGLVIAALTYFLSLKQKKDRPAGYEAEQQS